MQAGRSAQCSVKDLLTLPAANRFILSKVVALHPKKSGNISEFLVLTIQNDTNLLHFVYCLTPLSEVP